MRKATPDSAIIRALMVIAQHPQVYCVSEAVTDAATGVTIVDVTFRVNLPSDWRADRRSPSGVLQIEPVRFHFPPRFPLDAPQISLREDFDRSRPHMLPFTVDGRPEPCISDRRVVDLLHEQGIAGVINQTAVWLDRAALGHLIDSAQGWEPARRDSLEDVVVANSSSLRSLVQRQEGHAYLPFTYTWYRRADGRLTVSGSVGDERVTLSPETAPSLFDAGALTDQIGLGRSVALLIWPGKTPSGEPMVCSDYTPDQVGDVAGLRARAVAAGCVAPLNTQLGWIGKCLSRNYRGMPLTMAVVVCTRRPFHLIGSESDLELCMYVFDVLPARNFQLSDSAPVRPAAHSEPVNVNLLWRMSGDHDLEQPTEWSLVGCGSVGSKIALHLARAGCAPARIIDNASMRPHNAARHALIPSRVNRDFSWSASKASLLEDAIVALDQSTVAITADAADLLETRDGSRKAWPKNTWAVVNASGSMRVREAFTRAPIERLPSRVIETALFSAGRIALMTVEGPKRNPATGDLVAEAYAIAAENPELAQFVVSASDNIERRLIGEACGSATMVMSDGRLSLLSAAMAEAIRSRQRAGLSESAGEIITGVVAADCVNVQWTTRAMEPVTVVRADNSNDWLIRIHSRVKKAIREDIAKWPHVETGGILFGRVSEASRTFNVTGILPAPADTKRSASEFVLGVEGVPQMLKAESDAAGWTLFCLGTWHNHLATSSPSGLDRNTSTSIALARLMPSLLLIAMPGGFRALVADATTHVSK